MAQLLSETEIQSRMSALPGWTLNDKKITYTKTFKDFVEAIAFINRLVEPAEAAGHHPDLAVSYNKVTIALTSHDAGGLTAKDFELGSIISQLG
ncbi:4a-hydroxytetrahydrobiopterin dehydratase [Oculatella sp. LEGE 06141]|nr:4a-hydroxytetrahydrobiopterin dehydratase [Oculatella sp. LEGE 06141]MBE9183067.1 4a-hydroxytetrahydrobiopterin dehydratase [Oculatella sp. LEGE 06141]